MCRVLGHGNSPISPPPHQHALGSLTAASIRMTNPWLALLIVVIIGAQQAVLLAL
jgi:hypothetical protein